MTGGRSDDPLAEVRISGERVYEGVLLRIDRDEVRLPNGTSGCREYIRHPGAVLVVPLDADGQVVLERQFRYPLRRSFIEFPAGKRDLGESPLDCGRRELREETGLTAGRWTYLGSLHNAIAYANERIDVFLARDLQRGIARPEAGESLVVFEAPWRELLRWARDGTVTDAKTVVAVHWLERYLEMGWTPPDPSILTVLDRQDHDG